MHHKKRFLLRPLPPPVHFLTTEKERGTKGGKKSGLVLRPSISHERRRNLFICQNRLAPSFLSSGARNCEWGKATTISYLPAKSFSALDRQGKEGGRGIMQAPAEALPCPVGPSTNVNSGGCTKKFVGRALLLLFLPFARGLLPPSLPPSLPPCPSTFFVCIFLLPPFFAVLGQDSTMFLALNAFLISPWLKKHDSFCCALFSHLKTFVKFLIPNRAFRSSFPCDRGRPLFLPSCCFKKGAG